MYPWMIPNLDLANRILILLIRVLVGRPKNEKIIKTHEAFSKVWAAHTVPRICSMVHSHKSG
jgi:hypothetical protein